MWDVVKRGAEAVLERKADDHAKYGRLLRQLLTKGLVNSDHVSEEFFLRSGNKYVNMFLYGIDCSRFERFSRDPSRRRYRYSTRW